MRCLILYEIPADELANHLFLPNQPAAEYTFDAFTQMLDDQQVEVLVVTTVDATHDRYIIPALKRGIRVLTEKPMTTDIEKSKAILRAVKETNNHLTVTFVSTRLRFTGLVFFLLSFVSVARVREKRLIIDALSLAHGIVLSNAYVELPLQPGPRTSLQTARPGCHRQTHKRAL